VNNCGG